jgi:hypothetical protein
VNLSLTCSEPLVWTCKACGHSFHTDEWQAHGRQCPACNAHEGSWHCGKCQAGFTQPSLGSEHPCLANNPHGKRVRLVSRAHTSTHLNPRSASLIAPSPTPSRQDAPIHPRNKFRLPTLVILLIGIGAGLLFSGKLGQRIAIDNPRPITPPASNGMLQTKLKPNYEDTSIHLNSPPDIFQDRHTSTSDTSPNQNNLFAPEETPLGIYQREFYKSVGSRWNLKVQEAMTHIGVGRVVVGFYISPEGNVSDLKVEEGEPDSTLATISTDSIEKAGEITGPFPSDLAKEKPEGFRWKLSFRIY